MTQPDFSALKKELAGRDRARNTLLLFTIITFLVCAGFWASITELDNVTRGEGEVTSASQNQMVQAAEGGVILRRHVEENDIVSEGDLLFEIDPITAQAELDRTNTRLLTLQIREMRLNAEVQTKDFQVPVDIAVKAPEVVQSETSLFNSKRSQLNAQITILGQQKAQRTQELLKSEIRLKTAEELGVLLARELSVIEPLVREKIAPETRLLELQRNVQNNIGEQQSAQSAIAQAQAAIAEVELQIENATQEYKLNALKEVNEIVSEREQLEQSLPALEDRVSRTVVRAPMDGIVNSIKFRTVEAYVRQGEVLLEMVPLGDDLILQAKIQPKDISGIKLDDKALIRLSAYDSAKYGSVDGHVIRISADAMTSQQGDSAMSFYLVDLAVDTEVTLKTGKVVTLLPGMTATVDVLSGKRSILEYFWQPIARVQELALRD